jgi:hypothetical protein
MSSAVPLSSITFGVIGEARGRQRRRRLWTAAAAAALVAATAGSGAALGGAFAGGQRRVPPEIATRAHHGPGIAVRCGSPPVTSRRVRFDGVELTAQCTAHRAVLPGTRS